MEEQKEGGVVMKTQKEKKQKKTPSILYKIKKNGRHTSPCMSFLRTCILPFVRFCYPFKEVGAKRVADGPCVYVCNHYRMVDPMYILPTTKEGVHFIAKKEAEKIPVLGFFIRRVKAILVNRDGSDARAIMDGLRCLKYGDKLAIYPEGKRNKTDEPFLPFKSGSALFAIRAKVPIIPVVIYQKAKFFRMNYVIYGEPFELEEYYGVKLTDELLQEADEKILTKMKELWAEQDNFLKNKKRKKQCK